MSEFEPVILAFLCNWCSYAAADSAGTGRKPYPAGVRVVRVMCSGRVEPQFVLEAFSKGADGVLVCGCHPGDCHYIEGNMKAERRAVMLKKLLGQFGIEPERFRLEWVSASEGDRFVEIATAMSDQVRKLGPLELDSKPVLAATEEG